MFTLQEHVSVKKRERTFRIAHFIDVAKLNFERCKRVLSIQRMESSFLCNKYMFLTFTSVLSSEMNFANDVYELLIW